MGYRSAPHDVGKTRRKKRPLTEERGFTTPKKSRSRGGWTTEHPGEFSPSESKWKSWRSPVTPSTKSTKIHSFRGNKLQIDYQIMYYLGSRLRVPQLSESATFQD